VLAWRYTDRMFTSGLSGAVASTRTLPRGDKMGACEVTDSRSDCEDKVPPYRYRNEFGIFVTK